MCMGMGTYVEADVCVCVHVCVWMFAILFMLSFWCAICLDAHLADRYSIYYFISICCTVVQLLLVFIAHLFKASLTTMRVRLTCSRCSCAFTPVGHKLFNKFFFSFWENLPSVQWSVQQYKLHTHIHTYIYWDTCTNEPLLLSTCFLI